MVIIQLLEICKIYYNFSIGNLDAKFKEWLSISYLQQEKKSGPDHLLLSCQ